MIGLAVIGLSLLVVVFILVYHGKKKNCTAESILLCLFVLFSAILDTVKLPVVGTKLVFADTVALLLFGVIFFKAFARRDGKIALGRNTRIYLFFMWTFIAWAVISGFVKMLSDGGTLYADLIIEILNYTYGGMIATAVVVSTRDPKALGLVVDAWMYGALIVGVGTLLTLGGVADQWGYNFNGGVRISSTFRAVNQLPSYICFIIPCLVWRGISYDYGWANRCFWLLVTALSIASVMLTGSRTGVVLCIIGMLCAAWVLCRRLRVSTPVMAFSLIFCVAITAVFYAAIPASWKFGTPAASVEPAGPIERAMGGVEVLLQGNETVDLGPRAVQFRWVLNHFDESFVFGVGPARFHAVAKVTNNEVHNTYLGVLIGTGVVGLVLLLLFLAAVVVRGTICLSKQVQYFATPILLLSGFVCLLAYGMLMYGLGQRVFWLGVGLVIACFQMCPRHLKVDSLRRLS